MRTLHTFCIHTYPLSEWSERTDTRSVLTTQTSILSSEITPRLLYLLCQTSAKYQFKSHNLDFVKRP